MARRRRDIEQGEGTGLSRIFVLAGFYVVELRKIVANVRGQLVRIASLICRRSFHAKENIRVQRGANCVNRNTDSKR